MHVPVLVLVRRHPTLHPCTTAPLSLVAVEESRSRLLRTRHRSDYLDSVHCDLRAEYRSDVSGLRRVSEEWNSVEPQRVFD